MSEEENPLGNVKQQLEESEQQVEEGGKEGQDNKDPIPEEEDQDKQKDEYSPPFPFSETHQRPLYPHEETWEEWEDAKFEAEATLRKNGVRDPHGREFDDALLKIGIENPELVAEYILDARGLEPEENGQ